MDELKIFLQASPSIFKGVAASTVELRRALAIYLARGKICGVSQEELIDYLGISTPTVLELSGFSDSQQEYAMFLLGELTDTEIQDAKNYV